MSDTTPSFVRISMPDQFVLEVRSAEGAWLDHGLFSREDFARLEDGSYVCAGHGGAPVFLRALSQRGARVDAVDGAGAATSYRLEPFPSQKYRTG
jgi:hypothetical protein